MVARFDFFFDICTSKGICEILVAEIAQLVERFTRNEEVPGSSPGFGSHERRPIGLKPVGRSVFSLKTSLLV